MLLVREVPDQVLSDNSSIRKWKYPRQIIHITDTPVSIEWDFCFPRLTAFGSNKNNAVRTFIP